MWICKECKQPKVYEPEKPGICDYCLHENDSPKEAPKSLYGICQACQRIAYFARYYTIKHDQICFDCEERQKAALQKLFLTMKAVNIPEPIKDSPKKIEPEPLASNGGRYVELD